MNLFVVREIKKSPFEHCGRILLRDEELMIIIDGWEMFHISPGEAGAVIMGLGTADILDLDGQISGKAWLSESGRGFYCTIRERVFSVPAVRVKMVLSKSHKKAAVFELIKPGTTSGPA